MGAFINSRIKELSFGELRYLEIKLIVSAPVYFTLLDEPFQGLAPLVVERVKDLIKKGSTQKGLIITDHNNSAVLDITTKNYVLHNHNLVLLKEKEDLKLYGYSL